ncbi:MAG TPA: hypothetical protein VKA67_03190, partial [Verrucomicrobiae bacterium]|nr:hypothetical protein [Verrucomicrobiae bacterium]
MRKFSLVLLLVSSMVIFGLLAAPVQAQPCFTMNTNGMTWNQLVDWLLPCATGSAWEMNGDNNTFNTQSFDSSSVVQDVFDLNGTGNTINIMANSDWTGAANGLVSAVGANTVNVDTATVTALAGDALRFLVGGNTVSVTNSTLTGMGVAGDAIVAFGGSNSIDVIGSTLTGDDDGIDLEGPGDVVTIDTSTVT